MQLRKSAPVELTRVLRGVLVSSIGVLCLSMGGDEGLGKLCAAGCQDKSSNAQCSPTNAVVSSGGGYSIVLICDVQITKTSGSCIAHSGAVCEVEASCAPVVDVAFFWISSNQGYLASVDVDSQGDGGDVQPISVDSPPANTPGSVFRQGIPVPCDGSMQPFDRVFNLEVDVYVGAGANYLEATETFDVSASLLCSKCG